MNIKSVDTNPRRSHRSQEGPSRTLCQQQQKLMAMEMDPCKADKYIFVPGRWMTLMEGKAYQWVLRGLVWSTHMSLYGNFLHTMHKDLTARLLPS